MANAPQHPGNPCLLKENEQIAAKIWELLRRNDVFRAEVQKLRELDAKERENHAKTGEYHGSAWHDSWQLVENARESHPFAGVALQWLVPEPLFIVKRVLSPRLTKVGEGTTPDTKDSKHWSWWKKASQTNHAGRRTRRGPEVIWSTGDKVNPLLEWQQFHWPFTVEHSWKEAPPTLRRQFQLIWRSRYDCRPTNPISKDRSDSPHPHETVFFQGWNLGSALGRPSIDRHIAARVLMFDDLAQHYRLLAFPCQLLTRQAFKKAFELLYEKIAPTLLNERHFFGTPGQWKDFLAVEFVQSNQGATRKHAIHSLLRNSYGSKSTQMRQICQANETDVTHRIAYIEQLRDLIFPGFPLRKLLVAMPHRRSQRPAKRK
jgi:hypothetical protein